MFPYSIFYYLDFMGKIYFLFSVYFMGIIYFLSSTNKFHSFKNVFRIYFSIYPSEEFFKNLEKDTIGSLKNSCSENCNQNYSKLPVGKLIFYLTCAPEKGFCILLH